jgi:integrase/recombinase XerC
MPVSAETNLGLFLDFLKFEKRYSVHTLTSYESDLVTFFSFTAKQYDTDNIGSITHNMVRSWLAEGMAAGLNAKTINRRISSLKSFFKFHLRQETIEKSPMTQVISPKLKKRLPSFVKEEDTKKLLVALDQSAENWKSLNARMLISIFYATGMRRTELISLKEKQVDFSRSQIKVLGKGNKERVIPVSPALLALIREYQQLKRKEFAEPEDVLLVTEKGKKLYPRYAWQLVNHYLGEASSLDKKSPHVLRHTFATHLMNHGADLNAVRELLGHASLSSTQIYTHNSIEKLKETHGKAHPKA